MKRLAILLLIFSSITFGQTKQNQVIKKILTAQENKLNNFSDFAASVVKIESGKTFIIAQKKFKLNNRDKIIHLASVSKQFTGAAIAKLIIEGRIKLNGYVKDIIPGWPRYAREVKITHLLNHSSGLQEYTKKCWRYRDHSPKHILNKFVRTRKKLKFNPGSKYKYNNTGYVMLARVVEIITGKSFPKYMKQSFFKPLNMQETQYIGYNQRRPTNLMNTYYKFGIVPIPRMECEYTPGDGGVYTNLKDFQKWAIFLFGESPLGKAIPELIFSASGVANSKYGYGFKINKKNKNNKKYHYHNGVWSGVKTAIGIFPTEKKAILILANTDNFKASRVFKKIADEF